MKKDSLIVFTVLLLTLLLTFFYLFPLIQEDNEMDLNVEQQARLLDKSREDLNTATMMKNEYDKMTEQDKERYAHLIPEHLDQQSLINEISSIAQAQGVLLSAISFSKTTGTDIPRKVSILANFSSVGENNPIVHLMSALEHAQRLFLVKNISLNLNKTRNDYTLTLESYYKQ
jgi:Tfp pilus assembly protein PilO